MVKRHSTSEENPLEAALSLLESGFPRQARRLLEEALIENPGDARLETALDLIPEVDDAIDQETLPQRRAISAEVESRRRDISRKFRGWLEKSATEEEADGRLADLNNVWIGPPPPMPEDIQNELQSAMGWRPSAAVRTFAPRREPTEAIQPIYQRRWYDNEYTLRAILVSGTALGVVLVSALVFYLVWGGNQVARLDDQAQELFEAGDFAGAARKWRLADQLAGDAAARRGQIAAAEAAMTTEEQRRDARSSLQIAEEWDAKGERTVALYAYAEALASGLDGDAAARARERIETLQSELAASSEEAAARRQAAVELAGKLAEDGRKAYSDRRFAEAVDLFVGALRLDPTIPDLGPVLDKARQGAAAMAEVPAETDAQDESVRLGTVSSGSDTVARPAVPHDFSRRVRVPSGLEQLDGATLLASIKQLEIRRRRLLADLSTEAIRTDPYARAGMMEQIELVQAHLDAYRAALANKL